MFYLAGFSMNENKWPRLHKNALTLEQFIFKFNEKYKRKVVDYEIYLLGQRMRFNPPKTSLVKKS